MEHVFSLSVSGNSFFHEIQTLQGPSIKGLEGTVQSVFIWWLNKGDPAHLYISYQQELEPELKLWGGGTSAAQEGCFFLSKLTARSPLCTLLWRHTIVLKSVKSSYFWLLH